MKLAGKAWNRLDRVERALLIRAAYPNRAQSIVDLEVQRKWQDLLPSTQCDLLEVDFSTVLGRNVEPI